VIRVENAAGRSHEFNVRRVVPARAGEHPLALPVQDSGVPWGGLSTVPAGGAVTTTIDFEPGEYVVGTWPGMRHATDQLVTVRARFTTGPVR
jgi:hypothetical protein